MFNKGKSKKLEKAVQQLSGRLNHIEQALEQLANKDFEYNVTIDRLELHQPVLEQLTFRLDQLDIHEVSGALNLGNNFGVRIVQDPVSKQASNGEELETNEQELNNSAQQDERLNDTDMKRTASGFTFTFQK